MHSIQPVDTVLIADRFPAVDDELVAFALSLDGARIEAAARPATIDPAATELRIVYREDDGALARALAFVQLIVRHPVRCALDRFRRAGQRSDAPSLISLAPAIKRLQHDGPGVRVHAIGSEQARQTAARIAALSGARHEHQRHRLIPLRRR